MFPSASQLNRAARVGCICARDAMCSYKLVMRGACMSVTLPSETSVRNARDAFPNAAESVFDESPYRFNAVVPPYLFPVANIARMVGDADFRYLYPAERGERRHFGAKLKTLACERKAFQEIRFEHLVACRLIGEVLAIQNIGNPREEESSRVERQTAVRIVQKLEI